jgi:hypothetical protein
VFSDLLCGWQENQTEVNRIAMQQSIPIFMNGMPRGNDPVLLYKVYREIAGQDDLGVQGIGDCVSWGFKHLVDYAQAFEIYQDMRGLEKHLDREAWIKDRERRLYGFEMTASEPVYALSRVEIGGQRGSYRDGSVGAWAAEAIQKYGTLSYRELARMNQGDHYDSKRAKEWGAQGLPDDLEPDAAKHTLATTSLVTNFIDAAHLLENGYGIAVCSNVGFQNGRRGQTQRDEQGFASPSGTWNHCMFLCGVRYDRPGLCCINQWPKEAFDGPLDLDQPRNSFWIDERVVNVMLSQRDSWTASGHRGYPLRPLLYRF